MEGSLMAIINDIKVFFYSGIQTLPLTMGGTLLVLGFGTANYAMFSLLLGYLVLVPAFVTGFNYLFAGTDSLQGPGCGIIPGAGTYRSIISLWVSMVYFFLGYIGTNAYMIYKLDPADDANSDKTTLRMSQCTMGMIAIAVTMVVIGIIRGLSGCENVFLMFATASVAAFTGYWWYLLFNVGALQGGRMADLFGIANRLLSPSAFVNEPVGCVPIA